MGGVVKEVGKVFGGDDGGDDMRRAAEVQAQATREASARQAESIRQSAIAAAGAQQASINQNALATQLAEQTAQQPQESTTPDVRVDQTLSSDNPRRRYMGGGQAAVGGTSGGIGIRLS